MGTGATYAGVISYAIYNYLSGNHNPETYDTVYRVVLPFNRTTYTGFAMALFTNLTMSILYAITTLAIVGFFGTACYYTEGCISHFQNTMKIIDDAIKTTKFNSKKSKEQMHNAISFHIKLLE